MKLVNGKRYTQAYWTLKDAINSNNGLRIEDSPVRYRITKFHICENLKKDGLLEIRYSGPRGGKRYHATDKAIDAIGVAMAEYENKNGIR